MIALPLQKEARKANNNEFIDQGFEPYPDQWAFLDRIRRLSADEVTTLTSILGQGNELGVLKRDEDEPKPWETTKVKLLKTDFPREIEIVKVYRLSIVDLASPGRRTCFLFRRPKEHQEEGQFMRFTFRFKLAEGYLLDRSFGDKQRGGPRALAE